MAAGAVLVLLAAAAAAGAAQPGEVRGTNGQTMTAKAFQKAKQLHRIDPANNPDPLFMLNLSKNMGYDVHNGRRSAWRPRPTDGSSEVLDRVVGHLEDGRPVTLRQLKEAQLFHRENPSAPKPPELRLEGTSYSASLSAQHSGSGGGEKDAPDDATYERLLDYERATGRFYGMPAGRRERILHKARGLVERCGLEDVVGVDLKHRHFEVPPGQVLLEQQHVEARESVMSMVAYTSTMIPFSFMLSGGRWEPYEFVGASCQAAAKGLQKVREQQEFLDGMAYIVAKHGVEDVLGFHILHRNHLAAEPHGSIETAGRARGELLLRPYTDELFRRIASSEGDTSQVMWSWQNKQRMSFCGSHSCGHCNHCSSHCNSHRND